MECLQDRIRMINQVFVRGTPLAGRRRRHNKVSEARTAADSVPVELDVRPDNGTCFGT